MPALILPAVVVAPGTGLAFARDDAGRIAMILPLRDGWQPDGASEPSGSIRRDWQPAATPRQEF